MMNGMELALIKINEISNEIQAANFTVLEERLDRLRNLIKDMRDMELFMTASINKFQDYAKLGQGLKLAPKLESFNLMQAVQLPIRILNCKLDRIKLDLASNNICPNIFTDKQWLQDNLLCLLSNALKYSNSGDIRVTISLIESNLSFDGSDHDGEPNESSKSSRNRYPYHLLFEVEDEGIGMSEDAMRSLFSPFQQTQRLAGGTGLGEILHAVDKS